ncbi:hypothetical protein AB0O86_37800 [Streptomyces hirsutus]|uniref:hypothetical protein n=1 Tax=Streptomyces hirsutus TaxID=35620 RepID=UPI00342BFEC5
MTTASKEDIQHMRPKQRNKYRRLDFTWAEIKKIDRAIGRREATLNLKTTAGEVTLALPPAPDRTPEARDQGCSVQPEVARADGIAIRDGRAVLQKPSSQSGAGSSLRD